MQCHAKEFEYSNLQNNSLASRANKMLIAGKKVSYISGQTVLILYKQGGYP